MSGVYDGLTVIELADRRNQWAGKLLSDGGARDANRAAQGTGCEEERK